MASLSRLATKAARVEGGEIMARSEPYRILFVCLGNICRSPSAENIMRAVVNAAGLSDRIVCDSAGTMGWHQGKAPDHRMTLAAEQHGYAFTGSARQVTVADFDTQDLILAMDRQNLADLQALASGRLRAKLALFASYCTDPAFPDEVPDPYYGEEEGFHTVIRMVENGCHGLLARLVEDGVVA